MLVVGGVGALLLLRLAVHRLPWLGPWLADQLRAVVGNDAVTWLEETSARLEDRARRAVSVRVGPRTLDRAEPNSAPSGAAIGAGPARAESAAATRFVPRDVGPLSTRMAAAGDGQWRPVSDPARPGAETLLFETLLHPDLKRSWAEVFVVAMPVSAVRLYAVAGTVEPQSTTPAGSSYVRTGLIPPERRAALLAAFNGGFMTKHGQHGMSVDGVVLVPAKPQLCTLLALSDGSLQIASFRALGPAAAGAEREGRLVFWRQGAPCMYESGRLNPLLADEQVRNWGATIDGDVVIRRSAVGLDRTRSVLFVAISNDTTARALADAVHHAGADDVMQLDVNWSYPRFLLFPRAADGSRRALGLFAGFVFQPDQYVRRPSTRDFFYLVRREATP